MSPDMGSLLLNSYQGDQPLIATAIHHGHHIRDELHPLLAVDDVSRLREEDPFTGEWTVISDNRIIVDTSRFEVDLNRVREEAVYFEPEHAWGLTVWKSRPDTTLIDRSLTEYDFFYTHLHKVFTELKNKHGKFIVYDLHAYNYRRNGPDGEPAECEGSPDVNVGTGTMGDRAQWAPVIDRFIKDLSGYDFCGRHLDVRENIKFVGRQMAQWTHDAFPESACVLSIDFKKFFMDEWSGQPDAKQLAAITDALKFTISGVLKELK